MFSEFMDKSIPVRACIGKHFMIPTRGIDEKSFCAHHIQMDIYTIRKARLTALIAHEYGDNKAEFSRKTGISAPQVSRWLSDTATDTRNITEDSARAIEHKTGKPLGWLDLDQDSDVVPKYRIDSIENRSILERNKIHTTRKIPILGRVNAGNWRSALQSFNSINPADWLETSLPKTPSLYAWANDGDAMEPRFPSGALLTVDGEEEPLNGDIVIAKQAGSPETICRQFVREGGQRYLKPLNPRYPIAAMAEGDEICGVVLQMTMQVRSPMRIAK